MTVIIVDGAQAFCNVDLKGHHEMFRHIDVFLTSGHKFAGGKTYTGLLWVKDDLSSAIEDPAIGYTRYRGSGSTSGSTGDMEALTSLRDALDKRANKQHSTPDGEKFATAIHSALCKDGLQKYLVVQDEKHMSGIATLWDLRKDPQVDNLKKELGDFTELSSEPWRDPKQGIRRGRTAHCLFVDKPWKQDEWHLSCREYPVHEEKACAIADKHQCVVRLSYPSTEECLAKWDYKKIAEAVTGALKKLSGPAKYSAQSGRRE